MFWWIYTMYLNDIIRGCFMGVGTICKNVHCLAHRGQVTHIYVMNLGHHWFRSCIVACSALSHYLNQCCIIFHLASGSKFQSIRIKIRRCLFEQINLKVSSAACRPFCLHLNVLSTKKQNTGSVCVFWMQWICFVKHCLWPQFLYYVHFLSWHANQYLASHCF